MKHKTQDTKIQNIRKASTLHASRFTLHERGFTLIELMIIVGIIVLLYTIALINYNIFKERAQKNSALTMATAAMKELLVCANNGGYAITGSAPTAGDTYICCNASACAGNVAQSGYSAKWPDLGGSGWNYGNGSNGAVAPSGFLTDNPPSYIYWLVRGTNTIICTVKDNKCQ